MLAKSKSGLLKALKEGMQFKWTYAQSFSWKDGNVVHENPSIIRKIVKVKSNSIIFDKEDGSVSWLYLDQDGDKFLFEDNTFTVISEYITNTTFKYQDKLYENETVIRRTILKYELIGG